MEQRNPILLVMVIGTLALAALACNVSTTSGQNAALDTPTPGIPGSPPADDGRAAGCTLAASLSAETVPDGTEFQPNTAFVKTWTMQNSGTCDWEAGSQLVFISGDAMGAPGVVGVAPVPAGGSADVAVNFTSPAAAGTYTSYWQLRSTGGELFGELVFVQIVVPGPTPAAPEPAADWDLYRNGDHGPVVYAIQYLLRAEGYALAADGAFGPQTTTAVKSFQTAHSLAADGIVGPKTWTALTQGNMVRTGSHGDAVRAVQYLLVNLYGYGIDVDGIFGPDTDHAVRDFQTSRGLTVDGIVGPNTWKALVTGP